MSEHNPFQAFGVVGPAILTQMKTVFVRPAYENTGRLRCEGTLVHSGKRVASSEGKVFDGQGRLVAYGSETCLITDLGSKASM